MDFCVSSSYISRVTAILYLCVWLLLGMFAVGNTRPEDSIHCLKSIKESLEDPFSSLSTWDFNIGTEFSICGFRGIECWNSGDNRVLNITLRGMGLKGEFPRGIANCTSLVGLDLSDNHLHGAIPSDMSLIIRFTTVLNISFNDFSGVIPASIANCSYLNVLHLNNNHFEGRIPPEIVLLDRIKVLNVSNNLLYGPVLYFVHQTVIISYANNPGLCDGPFEPCNAGDARKKRKKILFTSGFIVGWVLFTIISLVVSIFCMPNMYAKKLMPKKKKQGVTDPTPFLPSNGRIQDTKIIELEKHITRMSFKELSKATDNFSDNNILGIGKLGAMFKAMLPNGWLLAIKKVQIQNSLALDQQILAELMNLGKLRHDNLVPLIGFCYDENQRLLVYKFMPHGNLHDFLISKRTQVKCIEWALTVKIAVGIAKGLSWLHQIGVVHQRICSKCILLDQNFEPKLSNFGSAKVLSTNSASSSWRTILNIGSWESSGSCAKDVYDFGALLIELIAGKEFSEVVDSSESSDGDLVERIFQLFNEVSQPFASLSEEFCEEILKFARVAAECVQSDPEARPTMFAVLETLSSNMGRYALTNDSVRVEQTEIAISS